MISSRYRDDRKEAITLTKSRLETRDIIKCKIESGDWKLIEIRCECGSSNHEILSRKNKFGIKQKIIICRDCGLVFNSPRIEDAAVKEFYLDYYPVLSAGGVKIPNLFHSQYERGGEVLDFLEKHDDGVKLDSVKTVFELGAGAGGILSRIKEKYSQIECYGTEYRKEEIEFASQKGSRITKGGIEDFIQENDGIKVDLIILYHVMEHFADISKELAGIKQVAHKDSIVFIGVPGLLETHLHYFTFLESIGMDHTYYFSKETLDCIMRKNGFECLCSDEKINSLYRVNKNSNREVSTNQYQKNLGYLKDLEKRRVTITYRIKKRLKKTRNLQRWHLKRKE